MQTPITQGRYAQWPECSQLLPSLSRVTPSGISEDSSELIGCPISRSCTAYCVHLEPQAPGLSLAGFRLVIPDHALGLPVFRARSLCCCHSAQSLSGRPAHCPFRGLLGVHSCYGLHNRAVTVYRDTLTEGFSRFVASIAAPVASGWSVFRVGFAPLENAAFARRTL